MLEKFGVHIMPFLGAGKNKGTITKLESGPHTSTGLSINSTSDTLFETSTVELPKEMALVLVLAQDCNAPLQQSQSKGQCFTNA